MENHMNQASTEAPAYLRSFVRVPKRCRAPLLVVAVDEFDGEYQVSP